MKYNIELINRTYDGKPYQDLVLTYENGKRFILVPLCKQGSKKEKSYFYALLNGTARK